MRKIKRVILISLEHNTQGASVNAQTLSPAEQEEEGVWGGSNLEERQK